MEHIIRPLVLYALFLLVISYVLKYIHGKDNENAILEYKIDLYLKNIRQDIINGYKNGPIEHMQPVLSQPVLSQPVLSQPVLSQPVPDEPRKEKIKIPSVRPYSAFFNRYYLIESPEQSVQLNTTQVIK